MSAFALIEAVETESLGGSGMVAPTFGDVEVSEAYMIHVACRTHQQCDSSYHSHTRQNRVTREHAGALVARGGR